MHQNNILAEQHTETEAAVLFCQTYRSNEWKADLKIDRHHPQYRLLRARIKNVGKSQSCLVSQLPIIWKRTRTVRLHQWNLMHATMHEGREVTLCGRFGAVRKRRVHIQLAQREADGGISPRDTRIPSRRR